VILGETSQQLLEPLIPFMSKKFGKKWALVGSDFGFPREYFKVAKKIMAKEGVQVLTEQYGPLGTTDWSSVIGKLKAVEPDVILGGVVGGDSIAFVKAAASLGLIPKAQLTGVTLQAEFYPAMGHAIDGLYSSVRYTEELQTPENEQLKKLYKAKYGNVPVPLVATTAYYSFNFIKAGIEQAKSFDPEAVIAAFRSGKVKAQTVVSDQPLSVDAASLAVNYPMYICQIKPGGVWSIVDQAGVVPPGISC
jgi:ABC-type branched-subunit amino acid transport system substrate-binding protein